MKPWIPVVAIKIVCGERSYCRYVLFLLCFLNLMRNIVLFLVEYTLKVVWRRAHGDNIKCL